MVYVTGGTQTVLGILLLVMGILGFIMCLIEFYDIARKRSIHPFKYFNMSHAVIHGAAQLIVVVVFISTQLLTTQWVNSSVVGYLALSFQFTSLYTSITMSLNRAIYGCSFDFDRSRAEFVFSDSTCGRVISIFIDIVYNIILVVAVIPIDIVSLYLLNKIAKKRAENTKRLQKEKPFFIQTLLNSVLFASMLICFHLAVLSDGAVMRFMMTTAAWEMWLMSPQIVALILLNETRRTYLKCLFCFMKKPVNAAVINSSTR
ncbi:hypothetical protein Y032_0114g424 [Ancylostoma ceylanicum]|nr:hypothetical protein Y032_0114g424 [Ancylostoma ceylanicum]